MEFARLGLPRLLLQGLEVAIQHAASSGPLDSMPPFLFAFFNLQLLRRKRVAAALALEAAALVRRILPTQLPCPVALPGDDEVPWT